MKYITSIVFCILLLSAKNCLAQNILIAPQAFNDSAVFQFTLTMPDTTTLMIYDRWGTLMKVFLRDSLIPAGSYRYVWNGASAPIASYVVIFKHGSVSENRYIVHLPSTSSTGFASLHADSISIHLYPNPAKDILFFDKSLIGYMFSIFDLTGREYMVRSKHNEVDISALPAGEYTISFKDLGISKHFVRE